MIQSQYEKEIIKTMKSFQRFGLYDVFADFVEWGTLSIRQAIELNHREEIEEKIRRFMQKYTPEEAEHMGEMFGMLIMAMQDYCQQGEYADILSRIFLELEIHSKDAGQFFTPGSVAKLTAKMTFNKEEAGEIIGRDGHITLNEPTVGGGIMVLAFAEAMRAAGFDPTRQLVIYAGDIDMRCACMSYLHFSLYGFPAVIDYGNALTLDHWQRWYSPVYVFDLWRYRDKVARAARQRRREHGVSEKPADRRTGGADESRTGSTEEAEGNIEPGACHEIQQLELFNMW